MTAVVGGCMVASVLIHYFTVASILWMLAESLLMFQKLVFVFKNVTKEGVIITSLVCWCKLNLSCIIPYPLNIFDDTKCQYI